MRTKTIGGHPLRFWIQILNPLFLDPGEDHKNRGLADRPAHAHLTTSHKHHLIRQWTAIQVCSRLARMCSTYTNAPTDRLDGCAHVRQRTSSSTMLSVRTSPADRPDGCAPLGGTHTATQCLRAHGRPGRVAHVRRHTLSNAVPTTEPATRHLRCVRRKT